MEEPKGCCCNKENPGTCNCVPRLSAGFAIRAYIAVILVQIVVMVILTVLASCMGINLREGFTQRFGGMSMEHVRA